MDFELPSLAPKDLAERHIVLGITGGIAAYKAAVLTRRLQDHGATVQVIMTDAATHFVTPVTFQALSGRPVYTSQWDGRVDSNMAHIDLSRTADAIVVVPASADFMSKVASGAADDLLSTLCLARECPLLLAPAMNRQMWSNPATQRNARQLEADGVTLLGPTAGDQACGEVGAGRMLEPEEILDELVAFFQPKRLAGRHVVITAGPTFEAIDPVRGITNLSSGKTGYAIARAAAEAGARVTLVSGPTALPTPRAVTRINVRGATEMRDEVLRAIPDASVFIAVAAVADWHVANPQTEKMKKSKAGPPQLQLVENPDILAEVARLPNRPYCVGFAAETSALDENAEAKRARKNVPLLVGNLAQNTFGTDESELVLYEEGARTALARADKLTQARRLVAEIARRL